MTADERLLSAQKQIWSAQLHNLKAQVQGIIDRMSQKPEELRKELVPLMHQLKEACKYMNDVEYSLDYEMREALKHSAQWEKDQLPA